MRAAALLSLGAAAGALADSLAWLGLLRLLSGATAGAIIPLAMAYLGDVVAYEQRQTVLARFLSGQILGVIFGQDLPGPKARIKLMVALGATSDVAQIRGMFEIAPAS